MKGNQIFIHSRAGAQLELLVDESALGAVVGDMASGRRGMVRAVHVLPQHRLVEAEAPLKELLGYSSHFRSLTRGSGSFTMEFLRYGAPFFCPSSSMT